MLGDQVFVYVLRGCDCILLSASCGWRMGIICAAVLVIISRCSAVKGGGFHRLAMAYATE